MISKYIIDESALNIEALERIDKNKNGFLVVINANEKVVGILTEGDIRRQLISGKNLKDKIFFNENYIFIKNSDDFNELFELFKNEKINYVPILDDKGRLLNIISKKQFHVLLLNDVDYNLNNLKNINENELDWEIFARPWGFYKTTLLSNHVQSKIITVFPESELSLQKHKRREEHWIIIKGEGKIVLEDSILDVQQGRYFYIPKGSKHKVINSSKTENLIFTEVQLGDYFGEDDIIRFEDKYGRV